MQILVKLIVLLISLHPNPPIKEEMCPCRLIRASKTKTGEQGGARSREHAVEEWHLVIQVDLVGAHNHRNFGAEVPELLVPVQHYQFA